MNKVLRRWLCGCLVLLGLFLFSPAAGAASVNQPAAPAAVKVSQPAYNKVKVSWKKVSGASGYVVFTVDESGTKHFRAYVAGESRLTFTDTESAAAGRFFCPGNTYRYCVKAYRDVSGKRYFSAGTSPTASVRVWLEKTVSEAKALKAVQNVITWNQVEGADGYIIYRRRPVAGAAWTNIGSTAKKSSTTFTDRNPAALGRYQYCVRAYRNINGIIYQGLYTIGTAITTSAPAQKVTLQENNGGIRVKWVQQKAGSGYRVFRKEGSGSYKLRSTIKDASRISFTDQKVQRGVTYTYYVQTIVKEYYGNVYSDSNKASLTLSLKSEIQDTYGTSARTGMSAADYTVLNNIIGAVETGGQVYGVRDYGNYTPPYANSSIEYTCTLGWGAFYGNEAQRLIRTIQDRDPGTFAAVDSNGLIADKLSVNWVNTRWKPNDREIQVLKKLLVTDTGKAVQDEMVTESMKVYAARCQTCHTNNTCAIMMYCEIAHLGGTAAADRILTRCAGNYSLDNILAALRVEWSSENLVGSRIYWSRHVKCAEFIQTYA
ncbi:MAG: hypothetical protein IIY55_02425 [Blautia sp.]|nr:hypothetical protein [Blautia sp.]